MSVNDLVDILKSHENNHSDISDILYGQVVNTSPLAIRVNSKMTLTSEFLELSHAVKSFNIQDAALDCPTVGSVQVFRDLVVGDTVKLLRVKKVAKNILY